MDSGYLLLEGIQKDDEPRVRLQWGDKEAFLDIEAAKELGLQFLETAMAADNDWQYLNSIGGDKVPWETKRVYVDLSELG